MKYVISILFFLPLCLRAQPSLVIEPISSGFNQPVDIAHAGDGCLFIVEKGGTIRILRADGSLSPQAFLDIDSRVNSQASERGLLGLAFHPDYENNGYFFVNYTANDGDTRVSRFSRNPGNPNIADPNSEKILLTIEQPFSNHNGGDLAFGPDGYLYIGLGDGGSGGDPGDRSQATQNLLGKMLRIDVDVADDNIPYDIPANNPFIDSSTVADEIWAIGLRNPWRFSFDRETGDMWIADVGQNVVEEINFQPGDSPGGENYGWRCYEGNQVFNLNGTCPDQSSLTFPVWQYAHMNDGRCRSVTGGYVYRGTRHPDLVGHYIYADFCTGLISSLTPDGAGGWANTNLLDWTNNQIVAFGEDAAGELYMAAIGQGTIYQVQTTVVSSSNDFPELGKVTLSPNPFTDQLHLYLETALHGELAVSLINLNGQEVFRQEEPFAAVFSKTFDVAQVPAGVYFLRLISRDKVASFKVIKQ
ncbi:MAG: PQQ-dependent sugar dehydrogenase [Lewinellaceae bacterium]|nr:PQQ-dependent sugar dehydrogenase [Lewinellaceae bacterium]